MRPQVCDATKKSKRVSKKSMKKCEKNRLVTAQTWKDNYTRHGDKNTRIEEHTRYIPISGSLIYIFSNMKKFNFG